MNLLRILLLVMLYNEWAVTSSKAGIFLPSMTTALRGGKGGREKQTKQKKKKMNIQTWAHFTGGENFGQDFNMLDKAPSLTKMNAHKEKFERHDMKRSTNAIPGFNEKDRNTALMEERKPFWERESFNEDLVFDDRREVQKLVTFSYNTVCEQLNDLEAKSVLDVGCGSGRFIMRANLRSPQVNRFMCVDRRKDALKAVHDCFHRALPLKAVISPRNEPMKVLLCHCDVRQPDHILSGYDVVTMLNVLEETSPESIPMLSRSVFNDIKPKHVICMICLSPELSNSEELNMNHVEWTDKVLTAWMTEIMNLYPYKLIRRIDNTKSSTCSNFNTLAKIDYDDDTNITKSVQTNGTKASVLMFSRTIEDDEVCTPVETKTDRSRLIDWDSLNSDQPSRCHVVGEFCIDKHVIVGKAGKASAGWNE